MIARGPSAVELSAVTKSFKGVRAVDNVSLEIPRGSFVSLLGPSGGGKTTTLRLIAGFERPDAGRVYIGGKDATDKPAFRRDVNTVFQNYAVFPHMTVNENIAYGLSARGVSRREIQERVREIIALVSLTGLEARMPRALSGGQQQRVALARALVLRPTVLLLDEPLGALDLKLRRQMQVELKQLQEKSGVTFLYVTHDQDEALTMSDLVAVMSQGLIVQVADPMTIYEQPATRFVATFVGEGNMWDATVSSVAEDHVLVRVNEGKLRVAQTGFQVGDKVTAFVRSERLHLNGEGVNVLPGVLDRIVYGGSSLLLMVRLENGEVAQCRHPVDRALVLEQGSSVSLSFSPNDVRLLRE